MRRTDYGSGRQPHVTCNPMPQASLPRRVVASPRTGAVDTLRVAPKLWDHVQAHVALAQRGIGHALPFPPCYTAPNTSADALASGQVTRETRIRETDHVFDAAGAPLSADPLTVPTWFNLQERWHSAAASVHCAGIFRLRQSEQPLAGFPLVCDHAC